MLEKSPAPTIVGAETLIELARSRGVTLFAAWHSMEAAGVAKARTWLAGQNIRRVSVQWKEDVRV